jgi:GNAT superfamily N-acetyltransferase
MQQLEKKQYHSVYKLYTDLDYFFPLIAAVLLDDQDGVVFVDQVNAPSQVYVEHAFGFSQFFGSSLKPTRFMESLKSYWLVEKQFHSEKVRLYSPPSSGSFLVETKRAVLSERLRFQLDENLFLKQQQFSNKNTATNIKGRKLVRGDLNAIENAFQVVNRFWRSPDDFLDKAKPYLITYQNKVASICYSAATVDGYAEIDVATLPEYRNLGLARLAVTGFVERCQEAGIRPLWDCYTNNEGSMALAKAVGFIPQNSPYDFFTISK